MTKFEMLYHYLRENNLADPAQFHEPRLVSEASLHRVHTPAYVTSFFEGTWDDKIQRRIGMPWYPALVTRVRAEVGGTVLTTRLAMQHGIALNTAGGTHHAYPDFGSGFCILNDIAVAAQLALDQGLARKVLIVDLDVHQGDGTAFIFRDAPEVFTFSMHGAKNFPFRKQASDCDLGLPDGADDAVFLDALRDHLPRLLDEQAPDLVIYDAGVDVHQDDRLGRLKISDAGLYQRDAFVLDQCLERSMPVACVVGGGYADDRNLLPQRHAALFRAAQERADAFGVGQPG